MSYPNLTNEQAESFARARKLYASRCTGYMLASGCLVVVADAWNHLDQEYVTTVLVHAPDAERARLETDTAAAAHWLEDARAKGLRL